MDFMSIITTEYHVVDTWVASYGHSLGIIYRYHTWCYPWYQLWMQRVMRSTYSSCEIRGIITDVFDMCICISH